MPTNDHLVLICGESAGGKSASLRNIPDPEGVMYLNCESGKKLPFPAKFKQYTITDPLQIYDAFFKAESKPNIHTIIVDSLTFMMDMQESVHVVNAPNTMQAWGEYQRFFRDLMLNYVAKSTKNVIFTAHVLNTLNETDMVMETKVPIKGALKNNGIESFFSTVIMARKIDVTKLKDQTSPLLTITPQEEALGFKYVYQTQLTKETVNCRIMIAKLYLIGYLLIMKTKKETPIDMMTGTLHETNNYGSVIVEKYTNSLNVIVKFVDTGFTITKTSRSVRAGTIKDPLKPIAYGVGFIGIGKHSTGKQGKPNKKYQTWKGMLERCYCKKCQRKHPTYIGCKVQPIWHNYQNFAEWYDTHYRPDLHIDKDKRITGNKTYGPDTCTFLTRQENTEISLAKEWHFISPEGEYINIVNLAKFCKANKLNNGNMIAVHHGLRRTAHGYTKYHK